VTASWHPRTIFERAAERHNLLVAESVLRTEIPRPTLRDLLELTAIKDPGRFSRVAARWLFKYLEAVEGATIDDQLPGCESAGVTWEDHARARRPAGDKPTGSPGTVDVQASPEFPASWPLRPAQAVQSSASTDGSPLPG
jgi:hypothetical protein